MKNAKAILVTLAVSAFMFGSCSNCVTCTYTPAAGGDEVSQDACGNDTERALEEAAIQLEAVAAGTIAVCE